LKENVRIDLYASRYNGMLTSMAAAFPPSGDPSMYGIEKIIEPRLLHFTSKRVNTSRPDIVYFASHGLPFPSGNEVVYRTNSSSLGTNSYLFILADLDPYHDILKQDGLEKKTLKEKLYGLTLHKEKPKVSAWMVDAGDWIAPLFKICDELREYTGEDPLKGVLMTHLHTDHRMQLPAVIERQQKLKGPKIPVYIGGPNPAQRIQEWTNYNPNAYYDTLAKNPYYDPRIDPQDIHLIRLADRDVIPLRAGNARIDITAFDVPGHSPEDVIFRGRTTDGRPFAFTGDVFREHTDEVVSVEGDYMFRRPKAVSAYVAPDGNKEQLLNSLERIALSSSSSNREDRIVGWDTYCMSGHGDDTSGSFPIPPTKTMEASRNHKN
jgi:glyoxylase-like metal-dependent hydrolase (beta-lactamase superfamily II)